MISEYAKRLSGQPMFKIAERVQGKDFIRFDIGDPDFDTPSSVIEAAQQALFMGKTHYTPSSGTFELKEAIQKFIFHHIGFYPHHDQICVAPGCNPLIYAVMRCLLNEGDMVAIPDPGFPTYLSVANFLGFKTVPIPLLEKNDFRIDPEDIKKLPKEVKLVVINSPNNPTGSMIDSWKDAITIFNACNKSNRFILSDEIYHLMTYGNYHETPCLVDKCLTNTIMINGFSKNFAMSGFRLGYMIGPDWLTEKVGLTMQTIVSCTSHFIQLAGCEAYERMPKEIEGNMKELDRRRIHLVQGLNEIQGITCTYPDGAFYVFPNIKGTGLTSQQFTNLLFNHRVTVVPGSDFGQYGEGYVRLAFTQPIETAKLGLDRIKEALNESR